MSAWTLALLAVLPALALPLALACRGKTQSRFIAAQMAGSVATMALVMMSFAFDQPSFIDLPLCLALLTLAGTLLLALFLERWL